MGWNFLMEVGIRLFRDQGQEGGVGGSSHITFFHPGYEAHQVFLNKGPEGSVETNRETIRSWGLIRVETPDSFFNFFFQDGGFKFDFFLRADK